jgi:hypothetical protein
MPADQQQPIPRKEPVVDSNQQSLSNALNWLLEQYAVIDDQYSRVCDRQADERTD